MTSKRRRTRTRDQKYTDFQATVYSDEIYGSYTKPDAITVEFAGERKNMEMLPDGTTVIRDAILTLDSPPRKIVRTLRLHPDGGVTIDAVLPAGRQES